MNDFFDAIARPFAQPIVALLNVFYSWTHSYAVAIGMITLCVMIILVPLNVKMTKSQLEMQRVQPEIKRLQQEYKNDVQARNQAMMDLYKEHKINPLGGCLPLLLQFPVLTGMWRAIYSLTKPCDQEAGCVIEGFGTIPKGGFDPQFLGTSKELYRALAGKTEMLSLGLDLSKPAMKVISDNILKGLPYLFLVLLVGGLSWYQQKQMTSRNTAAVNKQQQMIMNLMPIIFGFFSLTLASALIVYFLVQNVFRIGMNAYITRKFYATPVGTDLSGDGKSKSKPKPGTIDTTAKVKPAPSKPTPSKPTPSKPLPSKSSGTSDQPSSTPPKKGESSAASKAGQRPRPTPPSSSKAGKNRPQPPKKK